MFTGIVQGSFPIIEVENKPGLISLMIELPLALVEGLAIGASVSTDGVCLTVTAIEQQHVFFDVMQQTLMLTTLGDLKAGDYVNIERSAKQGVEVGGHIISGHVDGTAELVAIEQPENNCFITYRAPEEKMKYIFPKGFVGLNGCSLTVAEVNKKERTFKVCYIPETLRVTTHGNKNIGERVNFEVDRQTQAIVDTVENFLTDNPGLLVGR
ncbi:riboflavin synthase subunit alpha [Oceanicoccus sp. KOV_DT_Chl]|uniref:riboflavin synthase subunit alpha n=1 Tax=Oceanicoccus sp. KOV_DT_Chl TaxID=1904639 RepID=UPI000C7C97F6|nr:riboflavin synthase subunit alpha [Oceanicoccus sp. KOV_DT_Chl]